MKQAFEVETGVPLPTRHPKDKYNWAVLKEDGQSVFIQCTFAESKTIQSAARLYARRHGYGVVARSVDGGVRVWRVKRCT